MSNITTMPNTVFNIEPEKHKPFFSDAVKNGVISQVNKNDLYLFNMHKNLIILKKELAELLNTPNSAEKQNQIKLKAKELKELDNKYADLVRIFVSEYNDNGAKLRYDAELKNVTRVLNDPNSTPDEIARAELEFNKANVNYYQGKNNPKLKQYTDWIKELDDTLLECTNNLIALTKQQKQSRGSSGSRSISDIEKEIKIRKAYDAERRYLDAKQKGNQLFLEGLQNRGRTDW